MYKLSKKKRRANAWICPPKQSERLISKPYWSSHDPVQRTTTCIPKIQVTKPTPTPILKLMLFVLVLQSQEMNVMILF